MRACAAEEKRLGICENAPDAASRKELESCAEHYFMCMPFHVCRAK